MSASQLKGLLASLALVAGAAWIFVYFFLSTNTVAKALWSRGISVSDGYERLILFGLSVLGCGFFLLYRVVAAAPARTPKEKSRKQKTWGRREKAAQWVATVAILAQLPLVVSSPLGLDESFVGMALKDVTLTEIVNPFYKDERLFFNQNQTLTNAAAWVSTRVFGLSVLSLRGPVVLLCLVFLGALLIFSRRLFTPLETGVVYLMLLTHGEVMSATGLFKGYMALILFSFLCYCLVAEVTLISKGRSRALVFFLSAFFLVLSHTIGAVFLLVLLFALVVWFFVNRGNYSPTRLQVGLRYIGVSTLLLPLVSIVIYAHFNRLVQYGDLFAPVPGSPLATYAYLMGTPRLVLGKLWPILMALLFVHAFLYRREDFKGFRFIFAVSSFSILWSLYLLANVRLTDPRYFLGFLIPILLAVAESASKIHQSKWRLATYPLLVFLLLIPLAFKRMHLTNWDFIGPVSGWVQDQVTRISDKDRACFETWGPDLERTVVKAFYLPKEPQQCSVHYHFVLKEIPAFSRGGDANIVRETERRPASLRPSVPLESIAEHPDGHVLYRETNPR